MAKRPVIYGAGGEELSPSAVIAQNRQAAKDSFADKVVNEPEKVRPVSSDPIERDWEPPHGSVLDHVRHYEYLSQVASEIGSRLERDGSRPGAADASARASKAIADKELQLHLDAHLGRGQDVDPKKAFIHLRNAADALHDTVLHIKNAEQRNNIPFEKSVLKDERLGLDEKPVKSELLSNETGAPISLEKLQRNADEVKESDLGIFDKMSAVVDHYSNSVFGPRAPKTNYEKNLYATQIDVKTPRGYKPISSPIVRKESEQKPTRDSNPTLTFQGTPTTPPKASPKDLMPEIDSPPPAPEGMSEEEHFKTRVKAYRHWASNDPAIKFVGGITEFSKDEIAGMFAASKAGTDPHGYFNEIAENKKKEASSALGRLTAMKEGREARLYSEKRDAERAAEAAKTQGNTVSTDVEQPKPVSRKEEIRAKAQSRLEALQAGLAEREAKQTTADNSVDLENIDSKVDKDTDYEDPASIAIENITRSKHLAGFLGGQEDGKYQDV